MTTRRRAAAAVAVVLWAAPAHVHADGLGVAPALLAADTTPVVPLVVGSVATATGVALLLVRRRNARR